jgi:squalene-hopene/tetraprenyl-beta-curcumene cyclase
MSTTPSNPQTATRSAQPRFGRMDLGLDQIAKGIASAKDWLLGKQHPDGYWCGELEADVMLEADYIFMHTLLGTGDAGKMKRAVNEILRHQNEDGGWSQFPGGPSDINYGVKSYLALKLMGWSQDDPILVKARGWVLAHGGVIVCNTFTKIYL